MDVFGVISKENLQRKIFEGPISLFLKQFLWLLFLTLRRWVAVSTSPQEEKRMEVVIFPIPLKNHSENGGGHPSPILWQAPFLIWSRKWVPQFQRTKREREGRLLTFLFVCLSGRGDGHLHSSILSSRDRKKAIPLPRLRKKQRDNSRRTICAYIYIYNIIYT